MSNPNEQIFQVYDPAIIYQSKDLGEEHDITGITVEANIYEDIWKPFISASVVVSCSADIDDKAAFLSQDFVGISFKDADKNPVEFKGIINNVETSEIHRSNKTIVLHLIAIESTLAYKTKICHAWKNQPASKILKDCLNEIGITKCTIKNMDMQVDNYVAANISVLGVLSYFMKTYGRRVVFYQRVDTSGIPEYVIELLGAGTNKFPYDIMAGYEGPHLDGTNYKDLRAIALSYNLTARNDYMMALNSSEIGSERLVVDPIRHTVLREEWNMNDKIKEAEPNWHGNGQIAFREEKVSKNKKEYPKTKANTFISAGRTSTDMNSPQNKIIWKDKIKDDDSPKARTGKLKCQLTIPGNNKVHLNSAIPIILPTTITRTSQGKLPVDKFLSGDWTMTTIRRKLSLSEGYVCIIEASRDTVDKPFKPNTADVFESFLSTILGRLISSLFSKILGRR